MNEDMLNVLDEFRKMKIMYDTERFKLLSYQLENIMKDYEMLIKTRQDIQEKYFTAMENINENGMKTKIDYSRWDDLRRNENSQWKLELDELSNLKYEIDEAIKLLKNGEVEKLLIEEEEKLTGEKIRK